MIPQKSSIILMADDDADDRLLTKDAMSDCHMPGEVRFVEDGEELLHYLGRTGKYAEAVEAPRPSLILLDLNMPKKDGREALREIKGNAEWRKIPVVILTTSTSGVDVSYCYELGANSFISKPVTFDSLVKVMRIIGSYWLETVELPAK